MRFVCLFVGTILLCRFHQKLQSFLVVERPDVCHSTRSKHLRFCFKQELAFNPIWHLVCLENCDLISKICFKSFQKSLYFRLPLVTCWHLTLILINRNHFSKIIKDSGKGIKDFTALKEYYVHIQLRNVESFPV